MADTGLEKFLANGCPVLLVGRVGFLMGADTERDDISRQGGRCRASSTARSLQSPPPLLGCDNYAKIESRFSLLLAGTLAQPMNRTMDYSNCVV